MYEVSLNIRIICTICVVYELFFSNLPRWYESEYLWQSMQV